MFFLRQTSCQCLGEFCLQYIWKTNGKNNAQTIYKFLKKYHKNNFFVKIAKFNSPIGTGDVMNTNYCKISVCKDRKRNKIIIISVIDNLVKGASGQAVSKYECRVPIERNIRPTMRYLILLICSLLLFACSNGKRVYWCGDHACINNKERESYFKKNDDC